MSWSDIDNFSAVVLKKLNDEDENEIDVKNQMVDLWQQLAPKVMNRLTLSS